jgi:site-specific DNA-methyltransferase (adenine-specific)
MDHDRVYLGDCLKILDGCRESFDLIYADPPYNTGEVFRISNSDQVAYLDIWPGGISGFLSMLEPRIQACASILSPTGSFWIHLDHRTTHEVKVLCDSVFPSNGYQGEIIWVPGNGGKSRKKISVTHQTILVYSKGEMKFYGDRAREAFAKGSLKTHFKKVDSEGRSYRDRVIKGKTYRYYADEGKRLGSVWMDCPAMSANPPICDETTGYPTQKPLSLMTRIVELTTNIGDLVLDPFCGSGSTLEAAANLGRRWLGIDKSEVAFRIATERLDKFKTKTQAMDLMFELESE